VEIDAPVRDTVVGVIDHLRAAAGNVKWVDRQNLHLTLQFLGQVPANQIPDICDALSSVASGCSPFELEIRGLGAFPNARRPRTVWLGVTDGHDALVALQKQLQRALKRLGFRPEDRPFSPHLTIGRVREGGVAPASLAQQMSTRADALCGRSHIAEVVLFSSDLTPTGPIYTALGRAPLKTA
jgi:2'-5' RNA ligase